MTEKDDGGPANPVCVEVVHKYEDGRVGVAFFKNEGGMSLRDRFAIAVLAGVCSHPQGPAGDWDKVAADAYKGADAMLKARKESQ